MLLARASLAVLLRDPDVDSPVDNAPLAAYAAKHWTTHARFENVASRVRGGIEDLFDLDKPYFEAWVKLHDIDPKDEGNFPNIPDPEPGARPLYYAAFCGFDWLVEHLTLKYPQYVTARGGQCGTALHSALVEGHLQVIRYLLRYNVDVNYRDSADDTPLLLASWKGHQDIVQYLLNHGADVTLLDNHHNSALTVAAFHGHVNVVQLLLEHDADVHYLDNEGRTPLHDAVWGHRFTADRLQIVRLLLKHGANPNARSHELQTP